jgi:transposase
LIVPLKLPGFASFATDKEALAMPGRAAKVTITERQQDILRTIRDAPTAPSQLRQRAAIVLSAFEKHGNREIAAEVGLSRRRVSLWRRRWADAWGRLIRIEGSESHAALRRAIERALSDEPRPGPPGKFTPEQVVSILAVACEPPAKSGRPITHWTARELADEVIKRGIVPSISPAQVGRYLREAALQPHKKRYWLNTTEKDPRAFREPAEAVCDTYRGAPALARGHRTHTVSTDEMTGIQPLERNAPDRSMTYGHCQRIEFEYTRPGTLTLIGNFEVTTGELIACTIGPTRTAADFASHIEQTVATDPGASWIFVVDNWNLHGSESLVRMVAAACGIDVPLGKKGARGVLRSVASRQAFLSERGHRIRFVYTPKHSSWLNQIEVVVGVIMRKVIRRGSFTSVADLRSKLLHFIDYFNRVFARPFHWTYTGRPLRAEPAA